VTKLTSVLAAAVLFTVSGVIGCGDNSPGGAGSSGSGAGAGGAAGATATPTISITSPAASATVTAGTDTNRSVPITIATMNYTLMTPGSCGTTANCGHVHVYIDGTRTTGKCKAAGVPYNIAIPSAGNTSTTMGNLQMALCTDTGEMVTGTHMIQAELVTDGHASLTPPVTSSTVSFTVQ
jgi:hypothetical protein